MPFKVIWFVWGCESCEKSGKVEKSAMKSSEMLKLRSFSVGKAAFSKV